MKIRGPRGINYRVTIYSFGSGLRSWQPKMRLHCKTNVMGVGRAGHPLHSNVLSYFCREVALPTQRVWSRWWICPISLAIHHHFFNGLPSPFDICVGRCPMPYNATSCHPDTWNAAAFTTKFQGPSHPPHPYGNFQGTDDFDYTNNS